MKGVLTNKEERTLGKWVGKRINLPMFLEFGDDTLFTGLFRIVDNQILDRLNEDIKEILIALINALFEENYDNASEKLAVLLDSKIDFKNVNDEDEADLFKKAIDFVLSIIKVILKNIK